MLVIQNSDGICSGWANTIATIEKSENSFSLKSLKQLYYSNFPQMQQRDATIGSGNALVGFNLTWTNDDTGS